MVNFYEIAKTDGTSCTVCLGNIEEIIRKGDNITLLMVSGTTHEVVPHSLMLALEHSNTPFMIMGPQEESIEAEEVEAVTE